MEKKYQIFISSTYEDLKEAREKVRDAILSMMHFPIGMEMFSAGDEEQWEIIQETINSSDYYVLIVGQRYGSEIATGEGAGISYTEKEYRYAKEQKVPILAFILDDNAHITIADLESDPKKLKKLKAFKKEVATGRTVEWWKTSEELACQVTAALHKQMGRKKRPGWVRGDSFDLEASHAETLNLNQQVRSLLEENTQLKAQIAERKPQLTVAFDLDEPEDEDNLMDFDESGSDEEGGKSEYLSHGNLLISLDEDKMRIKLVSTYAEQERNRYEPLNKLDVEPHLKSYVTDAALRKYNEALPNKETVDAYIEKMDRYLRIHKGGIAFGLDIANDGTSKATDVRVYIDFPDEFILFKLLDLDDLKMPEAPALPANPIENAEREYAKRLYPTAFLGGASIAYAVPALNQIKGLNALLTSQMEHQDYTLYVDKHSVIAAFDQILHKTQRWFDGIYVVPTAKGTFRVKITMMCSEYLDVEEKYLEIEVV